MVKLKTSKFNKQYEHILDKGINYLTRNFQNVSYDKNDMIYIKGKLIYIDNNLKNTEDKRFKIFVINNKNNTTNIKNSKNIICFDYVNKIACYFCTRDIKWCKIDEFLQDTLKRDIRNVLGFEWKLVYIPGMFSIKTKTNNTKLKDYDIFKNEYKNLLWNFLWLSLKFKNPKFQDKILLEYFIDNLRKRNDLTEVLINFYEKINK